jgi:hypothetical protein
LSARGIWHGVTFGFGAGFVVMVASHLFATRIVKSQYATRVHEMSREHLLRQSEMLSPEPEAD